MKKLLLMLALCCATLSLTAMKKTSDDEQRFVDAPKGAFTGVMYGGALGFTFGVTHMAFRTVFSFLTISDTTTLSAPAGLANFGSFVYLLSTIAYQWNRGNRAFRNATLFSGAIPYLLLAGGFEAIAQNSGK